MKSRPAVFALSLLVLAGCQRGAPATPDGDAPTSAPPQVPAAAGSALALVAEGRTIPFAALRVWTADVGDTKVPQLRFFVRDVSCDDKLLNDVEHFYASLLADEWAPGEHLSPNWGFSGMPDLNPSMADAATYPPPWWGKVTVTEATATEVRGTLDYEAKGVVLRGPFVATRCP